MEIFPYDAQAESIFEKVKQELEREIGGKYRVEHHGSTCLKIMGQDEIDVYIPVAPEEFNTLVANLGRYMES